LNILNIIGTPNRGGVQTYIKAISKLDDSFNIKRNLLFIHGNHGELKHYFEKNGIKCYYCPIMPDDFELWGYRFWRNVRKLLRILFPINFFKSIKLIKPDIIIIDEPSYLNSQLFITRLLDIPVLWHLHNENQFINVNKSIFRLGISYYLKKHLSIATDSKEVYKTNLKECESIIHNYWNNYHLLPSTSDIKEFLKLTPKKHNAKDAEINFVSVGRLTWQKDFPLMLGSFHRMQKKTKKKLILSIIGTGQLSDQINEIIQKLNIKENINLVGEIDHDDLPKFFSKMDIYLQTSVTEGSPLTIKEAMAAGLPVVSSNVGGIKELVINDKTGILFSHNEKACDEAIYKMINMDFDERYEIGLSAKEYAKNNFSIEKLASKSHSIYSSILN